MCTDGVNAPQLKASIEQVDEVTALTRRWTHRAFHLADSSQMKETASTLREVQALLDEVRALLSDAGDLLEKEAASADASVRLV